MGGESDVGYHHIEETERDNENKYALNNIDEVMPAWH
jgi:hypothetical protein